MEINITRFVTDTDTYEFSGSVAERGDNAARETWTNAVTEAISSPLLTTPEQLDALRDYLRGFGAWDDEEIAAWSDDECNALFIQLISGDIREAGISGCIYRGDDGQIYYYLGS